MITAKINVTRIEKEHLFAGKNGKYLDLVIWENKNGPDQYGNTHTICQGISKEARDAGQRGPIIGNLKMEIQKTEHKPAPETTPDIDAMDDDEVPF
jgi:hypothetical protein